MRETRTVTTPDGRTLCIELAGRSAGPAVMIHQGTPNSRHLFGPWIDDAEQRGALLICYDRPGYGESTPQPGYRVADGAADAATVADALDIERFVVWGLSGGGPHSLACAALLPDRVAAAATIGSVAPFDAPGLDFFAGMGQENIEDIQLSLSDPAAARRKAEDDRRQMLAMTVEELRHSSETLVSEADARILAGAFGDHFHRCIRDGLAPGAGGWWDDGEAHLGPWGFELSQIRVPLKVWHGQQDQFVPFSHGEWIARQVPGAEACLTAHDGHLTVVGERIGEVHSWLLDRLVA